MCQRILKQKDVAQILTITPSRISEILNGKRGLTREVVNGTSKQVNIDPKIIQRNWEPGITSSMDEKLPTFITHFLSEC
jgi:plasmid maintenance system antidote protein VapI